MFKYAVCGGDPVYPTVNYVQDPDVVIDYRGPEFHEPTPEVIPYLMEVCDSISTYFLAFHPVPTKFY
jgi:hypothetical protein